MIERKILYYPTILVPSRWLRWAMLYWDKVSSIVPDGWEDKTEMVQPLHKEYYKTMVYLWEKGLFEPTRPRDFWRKAPRAGSVLEEEFKEIVSSKKFQVRINKNWQENTMFRMHTDKASLRIFRFLHKAKLAKVDRQDPSWYFVEENTSLLYLGLLAKRLADVDIDYTVPSTDWSEYETTIFGSDVEDRGFPSFKAKFIDVLPIPRDEVSIRDILRFKKKREDELLRFRRVVDELQRGISDAESEAEIKLKLVQHREKLQRERSNLKKLMKNSGIKTTFATFRSLIGIKSPAFIETIGFSLTNVPPIISVPIIAGTAFIQVGYSWIDNKNRQRAEIRTSPFSYLYYAEKEEVIQQ